MKREKNDSGLFGGVMLTYSIVLLHLLLIPGLGVLIILFQGAAAYIPLILFIFISAVCAATYYLFRHFKTQGKGLRDALNSPLFRGKSIEINLLGGIASIKINPDNSTSTQPAIDTGDRTPLLEDQNSERIRELVDLARSLENDHINQKATDKTGRNLFN